MVEEARFTEPRRLHPLSLVLRFLRSLPALLILLAPTLLRGSAQETWFTLTFALLYGVFVVPMLVAQYFRFSYWIEDDEIFVHSGVFTRRKRNIPMDRIQNIEIEQSLLPRTLGMAKVKIDTAGSTSSEGVLEYISLEDAHAIRGIVRRFRRVQAQPGAVARDDTAVTSDLIYSQEQAVEDEPEMLFSMPPTRVLLCGMYRFSLLFIALILSAIQYLQVDVDQLVEFIFRGPLREVAETAAASPWLAGFLSLITAALLSWITGIITTFNRYFGFKLWMDEDKLQRRHGLLTVSEGTIPLSRVQSIILRSNPLMQTHGWYRLELQTMGYDVEEEGYHVVVPFAQQETVVELARRVRLFTLPEEWISVSPITIRRHFVRYSVMLTVLTLAVYYFWSPAIWALVLLPLCYVFAVLHYRNHGYAVDGDMLYIKKGVIRKYIFGVPLEKMQVFYGSASIFQRRLGLKTLVFDTAGAGTFSYPEIIDMEADVADAFQQLMYRRFQAELDGRRARITPPDFLAVPDQKALPPGSSLDQDR